MQKFQDSLPPDKQADFAGKLDQAIGQRSSTRCEWGTCIPCGERRVCSPFEDLGQRMWSTSTNDVSTMSVVGVPDSINSQNGNDTTSITRDSNTGFTKETGLGAVTTHYSYDSFGQVISREARVNGDVMYRVDYTYDALGRIASTSEVTQGEGVATSYTYDDYDRLSSATVNGSTTAYSYDGNGNRLNNGALYDDQDRLVSDESFTYTYSARGVLKSKTKHSDAQTTVYDYDLQGNLREVSLPGGVKVTYGYDGRNRLVSRIDANGTLGFIYKDQHTTTGLD